MIKKSFTMMELIFVIVIVSIISVVVAPKFCGDACGKNSDLVKAANQVLSHIRYTRHLAMIDNKFVPNSALSSYASNKPKSRKKDSQFWFKKWWQIYFFDSKIGYAILSDSPSESDNNEYDISPGEITEIPLDPLTGRYLISYDYGGHFGDRFLEKMDLKKYFSIDKISVNVCNGSKHILFDNFGRPHCSKLRNDGVLNPYNEVITSTAKITLEHENGDIMGICVEAETGYSYICD